VLIDQRRAASLETVTLLAECMALNCSRGMRGAVDGDGGIAAKYAVERPLFPSRMKT
jgi:hypothetical protein